MFRDKYKDSEYFLKRKAFLENSIKDFLALQPSLPTDKQDLLHLYLATDFRNLTQTLYSCGDDIKNVYDSFKKGLFYYSLSYDENSGIFTIIDYLSLAVLFEDRKAEFMDDVEKIFKKYQTFVDEGEQYQDDFIDTLGLYLLTGKEWPYHSHLEYLNMISDTADSVIEAQKFWYYAHSEAAWYDTHKTKDAYYGYWSFDTAALCKMRGINDERFKELDFFPYDLLMQGEI